MPKNLVVCCDGTWNTSEQKDTTNVWRLHQAVAERAGDGSEQRAYYHRGVGTSPWDKYLGGLFGVGLSAAIRDSYRWLAENYDEGDRIYLLGFSRGAFTARSLAGLIRNAGILRRNEIGRVDEAYALYRSKEGPDAPAAQRFRARYAVSDRVTIEFVGVWDTVGALGVPTIGLLRFGWLNQRWAFHDVQLSSRIRHAHHALALDERREPFVPTLWRPQPEAADQLVEQVWFAGVHCDVGGGYPDRELADITLHWMSDRAHRSGVAFTTDFTVARDAALSTLHDSFEGVYKILGPAVREVGDRDPGHEYLSSTAAHRIVEMDGYGTEPARAYLARGDQQLDVG